MTRTAQSRRSHSRPFISLLSFSRSLLTSPPPPSWTDSTKNFFPEEEFGRGAGGREGGLKMNRRPGGILKGGWGRGANRRGAKKTILSPPLPPSFYGVGRAASAVKTVFEDPWGAKPPLWSEAKETKIFWMGKREGRIRGTLRGGRERWGSAPTATDESRSQPLIHLPFRHSRRKQFLGLILRGRSRAEDPLSPPLSFSIPLSLYLSLTAASRSLS